MWALLGMSANVPMDIRFGLPRARAVPDDGKYIDRAMADKRRIRKQSAVIPWRKAGKSIQVMLITSRDTARWVLPKGTIESNMSPAASAAREAEEEAGVSGTVVEKPIGSYNYVKTLRKGGEKCNVEVFTMRVAKVKDEWPEMADRSRKWMSFSQAAKRVNEKDLKRLLLIAARKLP